MKAKRLETEAEAAEALIDKRLRVDIPAPRLLRLFGCRAVPLWFRRPVFAQLLRISRLYVRMGIDLAELDKGEALPLFSEVARHGVTASRIIALGLLRTPLFHRPLARYLRNHLDAQGLAELTKMIVYLSGAENFASIIRSAAYMRVTMPTLSQQKETGS